MTSADDLERRARQSQGISLPAIYAMVADALRECKAGGLVLDVGCGRGDLWPALRGFFGSYAGVDTISYPGFPHDGRFLKADLNGSRIPLSEGQADAVVAVETIEHLENPRAFVRELVRLAKPHGWVLVTTPNILSLLSLITLLVKKRFGYFHDVDYPAHISPILEIDLLRIASECSLEDIRVRFSGRGRILLTPWHYPCRLSRLFPRLLSDNILVMGRKPRA